MGRIRWTLLLACALGAGALSWAVQQIMLARHGWVPALSAWGAVAALTVAVIVLVAGVGVRRLRAGRPTWMTLPGAAVTAAAAQASALAGALAAGAYGGELVSALLAARHTDAPAVASLMVSAAVCVLAGLVWCGVGVLVEHWCAIDESDDDERDAGSPRGASPHAGGVAARNGRG